MVRGEICKYPHHLNGTVAARGEIGNALGIYVKRR